MDRNTERDLVTILRELVHRRRTWIVLGVLISVIMLGVGSQLPKKYTTYASIVAEERNIIGPLMEGMAEPTDVDSMVKIVRELTFSRALLERIVEIGWDEARQMAPAERERLKEDIMARTTIRQRGGSLIGIEYTDSDPERAYLVTAMYVDWVLNRSAERKREESRLAFEFIDQQVQAYHDKLVEAEQGLREYRSANFDALPESSDTVLDRASALRREIENLGLTLDELAVKRESLQTQLAGEAKTNHRVSNEYDLRSQLSALRRDLSKLRLSYHDSYPDIVHIKGQISELERELAAVQDEQGTSGIAATSGTREDGSISLNLLYEDLRSQLAATETEIASTRARKDQLERMLESETSRGARIADAEVRMAELTRDYEVNRDIYRDLLRRRENARLSMSLDEQEGGLKMRVQEPPAVPQVPGGIRFMHVALASMLLVIALPLGVSAAIVRLDPRIRVKERLEEMDLPVLAVVHERQSATSTSRLRQDVGFISGLVLLVGIYAGAAILKMTNVI